MILLSKEKIFREKRNYFMKISNVLPALGIMLVISGCTPISTTNTEQSTAAQSQSENSSAASSEVQGEASALSDAELKEFTDLFNTAEYNGFLVNAFSGPDDVDWDAVIKNGAGLATRNAGVSEINDYLEATGKKELDSESILYVIKNSDLADYIQKHIGKEVSPKKEDISWDYLDKYDSYYFYTRFMLDNSFNCTCVSGEKTGDTYTLRFEYNTDEESVQRHYGYYADRILTLSKSGDDILLKSNEIQWDDHSDPKLTKDVELPQSDKTVHIVTYNEEPHRACMIFVQDGKSMIKGYANYDISILNQSTFWDEPMEYNEVISFDFFDYNADGAKDLAIFQNSDYGTYLRLFSATQDEFNFSIFAELNEEGVLKFSPTSGIDDIKFALLGGNNEGKKENYLEAYDQIARLYNLLFDSKYLKYDLIYANDDEVPELVVENNLAVSLYTYKNGITHCLINEYIRGSEFDDSYFYCFYAPKKGIYYSMYGRPYDISSGIVEKEYISEDSNAKVHVSFEVTNIPCSIAKPSTPADLENAKDTKGTAEYINKTGKKMTDDEVKAMVNLYDSYEKKELIGTMKYFDLIEKLK